MHSDNLKKYSLDGFKTGAKLAACFYIGATFACFMSPLCLIFGANKLANLLILPLAMLISNFVACVVIGVIFVVACAVTMAIAKPLFHLTKDFINERRIPDNSKTTDRDSGIVTLENDSFLHQTDKEKNYHYKLTTTDVRDIAKSKYGWIVHKDRKGLKSASEDVIFACPDDLTSSLEQELKEYKDKVKQGNINLIFTSILNLNKDHWVTLTIVCNSNKKPRARSNSVGILDLESSGKEYKELKRRLSLSNEDNNTFRAYYCDSFGKPLRDEISNVLQETLGINSSNVGTSKEKQQTDTHNCGIFALENAKKITDDIKKGKSFDEISTELSKYKPNAEQLKGKRIEFAKALKSESRANTPDNRIRKSSGDSAASSVSLDSGISVGEKEFCEDWPTLVHQTNRADKGYDNSSGYRYWLQQHDISYIARIQYGYLEAAENDVFFSIPGDVNSLNERLKEYKNEAEQENSKKTFTSVINLGGNHWVTLIVTYDRAGKKFVAYYCDSFGNQLPNEINGTIKDNISLANEITEKCVDPLTDEVRNLIRRKESNPDDVHIKEKKDDVEKTLKCARKDKTKLVGKPINNAYIVGALKETLGINDIRSSKAKQQNDGCNCGIFALENAHRITQRLTEGKSLDEVLDEEELSNYILNKEELIKKRQEFTRVLMNDEGWRNADASGLLYERAEVVPLTPSPSLSKFGSVMSLASAHCSIM